MRGYYQDIKIIPTGHTPGAQTTANGTGIDCKGFRTAILYANVTTGASKTYDLKVQESSDNGVADTFADVTSAAITQITANNKNAQIVIDCTRTERYLRSVVTAGSSPVSEQIWVLKDPVTIAVTQDADETVTPHT